MSCCGAASAVKESLRNVFPESATAKAACPLTAKPAAVLNKQNVT